MARRGANQTTQSAGLLILMLVAVIVPAVIGSAVLFGAGGGSGSGGSGSLEADQQAITRLVRRNVELINKRDWSSLYQGMSPRTRELCAYDRFRNEMQAQALLALGDGGQMGVENISVTVSGDVAFARFTTQLAKLQNVSTGTEVFVRVRGTWYLVDEHGTTCPRSDEPALSQLP